VGTFIAFLCVIVSRCLVCFTNALLYAPWMDILYGRKYETGSLTLLTVTSAAGLTLRNLKRLCSKNLLDKRTIAA
jgi:hypothetical protein